MEFSYATKTNLTISGLKSDELEAVIRLATDDGYGPVLEKVKPEYEYDYEGYPVRKLGTYSVTFETPWYSNQIKDAAQDEYEMLKEIENLLTE